MTELLRELGQRLEGWAVTGLALAGVLLAGLMVHWLLYRGLQRVARATRTGVDDALLRYSRRPAQLVLPLLALLLTLPLLPVEPTAAEIARRIAVIGLIGALTWLATRVTRVLDDLIAQRHDVARPDNLEARRAITQVRVLRRTINVLVIVLGLAMMLMTVERVRQLGTSILASAGVIGIILGVAAQRTIANFVAGLQIAVTQPIRIDDVVIVEGEWGRIEEITFTYVVVRIWDQRRLVVPISHFIEKPFQNWTRVTTDLIGSVYLYVDHTIPVDAVRLELRAVLEHCEEWDGETWGLQVTDAREGAIELRATMGAADASRAWTLRCRVREELLRFIQQTYPQHLPRVRAEVRRDAAEPAGQIVRRAS
jgi:small-conductance mechanosensitive channel